MPLLLLTLVVGPFAAGFAAEDPPANELDAAFEQFEAAALEVRLALLAEVELRLADVASPELRRLLALRERVPELPVDPPQPPRFWDPKEYAKGLVQRRWVDPDSEQAARQRDRYPGFVRPPFNVEVRYDYATLRGRQVADPLPPDLRLANLLAGYFPGADGLTAWLECQFNEDDDLDRMADHFARAYCELSGDCYASITLFDAFASAEKKDMPDVDVIAYARSILRSRSYRSPIPPGTRRSKLYKKVNEDFLAYFQERTFIEAVADLYLNPEAPLRDQHRSLRDVILYALHSDEYKIDSIRVTLRRAKDRDGFIRRIDRKMKRDRHWREELAVLIERRNEARWAVAETTHAVLREYGMLQESGS